MSGVVKKNRVAFVDGIVVDEMSVKRLENRRTGRLLVLQNLNMGIGHFALLDEVLPHVLDILHGSVERIARVVVDANQECKDDGHDLVLTRLSTCSAQWVQGWGQGVPKLKWFASGAAILGHAGL